MSMIPPGHQCHTWAPYELSERRHFNGLYRSGCFCLMCIVVPRQRRLPLTCCRQVVPKSTVLFWLPPDTAHAPHCRLPVFEALRNYGQN